VSLGWAAVRTSALSGLKYALQFHSVLHLGDIISVDAEVVLRKVTPVENLAHVRSQKVNPLSA
jgi:hypothetical protein